MDKVYDIISTNNSTALQITLQASVVQNPETYIDSIFKYLYPLSVSTNTYLLSVIPADVQNNYTPDRSFLSSSGPPSMKKCKPAPF